MREIKAVNMWSCQCKYVKYWSKGCNGVRFSLSGKKISLQDWFFLVLSHKMLRLVLFGRCDRMKLKQLSRFSQYDSSRFLYRGVLWNLSTAATRHWSIGSLNWQVWPRSWWHLSLRFAPNTFTLWLQSFIYRTSYILYVIIFFLHIPCFCLSWRRHSCCSSSGFISS